VWAREGFLVATEGSVIDYGALEAYVCGLAERFRIEGIAIDPWNSVGTQTRLLEEGRPVVRFRQGYASLSPAMKECERLILAGQLRHDGNPCLRWCVANTAVEMDLAGNVKPNKAKSKERIDGTVALIMSVGIAQTEGVRSVYEERPSFLML
jgi:phage terminase large subunit-like protein